MIPMSNRRRAFKSRTCQAWAQPVSPAKRKGAPPQIEVILFGDSESVPMTVEIEAARELVSWLGAFTHGALPKDRAIATVGHIVDVTMLGRTATFASRSLPASRASYDPNVPPGKRMATIDRALATMLYGFIIDWLVWVGADMPTP